MACFLNKAYIPGQHIIEGVGVCCWPEIVLCCEHWAHCCVFAKLPGSAWHLVVVVVVVVSSLNDMLSSPDVW